MNKDIATAWVTALRSGEYAQGRGQLHHPVHNEFCCLGVVCHVLAGQGKMTTDNAFCGSVRYVTPGNTGSSYTLPEGGHSIMDLSVQFGYLGFVDHVEGAREWWLARESAREYILREHFDDAEGLNLAGLNDNGVPFSDIADFIEAFADKL